MIMTFKSGEVVEISNITYKYSAANAAYSIQDSYTVTARLEDNVTEQVERVKASLTEDNISDVTVTTYLGPTETEFKFAFTTLVSIEAVITNGTEPVLKFELK